MTDSVVSIQALTQKVEAIEEKGESNFAPARFSYIKSLLLKAQQRNEAVSQKLCEKAAASLDAYTKAYKETHSSAISFAESIEKRFPDFHKEATQLIEDNKILQIDRLKIKSVIRSKSKHAGRLRDVFNEAPDEEESLHQQLSFDDFLLDHETKTIQSHSESEVAIEDQAGGQFADLKAHKLFKDSWVKMHADNLVTQAIKDAPENAGPLNSHMLAIKSLKSIRELSPEYLNRFVSYMDSLLWLEQAAEEFSSSAPGKKTKKSSRKGR